MKASHAHLHTFKNNLKNKIYPGDYYILLLYYVKLEK